MKIYAEPNGLWVLENELGMLGASEGEVCVQESSRVWKRVCVCVSTSPAFGKTQSLA